MAHHESWKQENRDDDANEDIIAKMDNDDIDDDVDGFRPVEDEPPEGYGLAEDGWNKTVTHKGHRKGEACGRECVAEDVEVVEVPAEIVVEE